ncbi:MAG: hypothetical protein ACRCSG_07125 [Cellulosilyticaceae bacterium]
MKKRYYIILIVLLIGSIWGSQKYFNKFQKTTELANLDLIEDDYYKKYEEKSFEFIKKNYMNEDGLLKTSKTSDMVLLSEQILYLTYLLQKDNEEDFVKIFNYIIDNMMTDSGKLSIGKQENGIKKYSINDQMEFCKLLIRAYQQWENEEYINLFRVIEEKLYEEYIKEKKFFSYYNAGSSEIIDMRIPLYFLDLDTIAVLGNYRKEWKNIYNQIKQMIENAYISDVFPFYNEYYDYAEEEYNKYYKGNMMQSVHIIWDLAQVELHREESIDWLKENLKKGPLYEEYNKLTGLPTVRVENPGIYGIVAQIGKSIGDVELYTLAVEKMLRLQMKEPTDENKGAFISTFRTGFSEEIILYDNLNALLAF